MDEIIHYSWYKCDFFLGGQEFIFLYMVRKDKHCIYYLSLLICRPCCLLPLGKEIWAHINIWRNDMQTKSDPTLIYEGMIYKCICSFGIALDVSKSQKRTAGQHWKGMWRSVFITPVGIAIDRILKLILVGAYSTCVWPKAVYEHSKGDTVWLLRLCCRDIISLQNMSKNNKDVPFIPVCIYNTESWANQEMIIETKVTLVV